MFSVMQTRYFIYLDFSQLEHYFMSHRHYTSGD